MSKNTNQSRPAPEDDRPRSDSVASEDSLYDWAANVYKQVHDSTEEHLHSWKESADPYIKRAEEYGSTTIKMAEEYAAMATSSLKSLMPERSPEPKARTGEVYGIGDLDDLEPEPEESSLTKPSE
eukprot:tig00001264_g7871.t1